MRRSVRSVFLFVGIICLASGAARCPGPPGGGGDDDRPPIIVSDGSVHLRVVSNDHDEEPKYDRGTWEKDPNKGNQWFHEHKNKKARRLYVNVFYGSSDTNPNCANPAYVFNVRELTVTYSDGTSDKTFTIWIDAPSNGNGAVLTSLTAATAERDSKVPEWLDVLNASHLVSVKLGADTCSLTQGKGQIHIYQRIQP